MAKRASDSYIQLNKKITTKVVIKHINTIADKWGVTVQEACYRLITDGAMRELNLKPASKKHN